MRNGAVGMLKMSFGLRMMTEEAYWQNFGGWRRFLMVKLIDGGCICYMESGI
jgi:hypothetical protein